MRSVNVVQFEEYDLVVVDGQLNVDRDVETRHFGLDLHVDLRERSIHHYCLSVPRILHLICASVLRKKHSDARCGV